MLLAPAAGAFAYFKPGPELYGNFGAADAMWPFFKAFAALRDGSLSMIDMSAAQGIVSFPSFHTVLGIITAYALRGTRWLFVPILLLNAVMIVSTLPVGGHHLADVIAGAAIGCGAILIVRAKAA
jgi:membrane-associated phospholipid phosphatase